MSKLRDLTIGSQPWATITAISIGLYLGERKRVNRMIDLNAEREQLTNEFNIWLKGEIDRSEKGES